MFKRGTAVLLGAAVVAAALAGCGKEEASTSAASENCTDGGKVLNIYCFDTDFESKVIEYYPGYVDNGDDTGSIGDVKVVWNIHPLDNNEYQNTLDQKLLVNMDAAADEKVDLFLLEADYILKYVDSSYTLDVEQDLGIGSSEMSDMYPYTKEIATSMEGSLKGVSWQATPGLFAYRRSIAKDILGTDDPVKVQEALSDWDKFDEVAGKAKKKGYAMVSGIVDTYRVFSNSASKPWVDDPTKEAPKIQIDDNIFRWVEESKKYVENGWTNGTSMWTPEWNADQTIDGKVFGFFYSTWGINFTLVGNAGDEGKGDWAVCEGPAPWYWGGTWLSGARGTDNASLVADIMRKMCCDKDNMLALTEGTLDYANNVPAMEELAASDFKSDFLGGQNHIKLFVEMAPKIDMSNTGPYDAGLTTAFQNAFTPYINGEIDKQSALNDFYDRAVTAYPELTYDEMQLE